MSETAPKLKLNETSYDHLLEAGGEHELPAHASPEKSPAEHKQNAHEAAQEARQALQELGANEISSNPLQRLEAADKASQPMTPNVITRQMQKITRHRELKNIQRRLPAPQRALSRLIHQPLVSAVSEGAGKTVSRPSGLLGGGLTAFIGSTAYVYLAYHIGFRANYLVFLILFFGGFVLGVVIELLIHFTLKRHHAE